MKCEIPNAFPRLVESAKIIALSTTYEFRPNMTFCMTISKNELDNGRRQIGKVAINAKNILLSTDSLFFEKNGRWSHVEKNDFRESYFKPMEIYVEKKTKNQIIISEKEANGKIYYTLDKIK